MIQVAPTDTLLLDTHALLWLAENNPRFGLEAPTAIESGVPTCVSVASLWEMSIKSSLKKLTLKEPIDVFVQRHVVGNQIRLITADVGDCRAVELLPTLPHRDPFDRMLVAQASARQMVIVTCDPAFDDYAVRTLW